MRGVKSLRADRGRRAAEAVRPRSPSAVRLGATAVMLVLALRGAALRPRSIADACVFAVLGGLSLRHRRHASPESSRTAPAMLSRSVAGYGGHDRHGLLRACRGKPSFRALAAALRAGSVLRERRPAGAHSACPCATASWPRVPRCSFPPSRSIYADLPISRPDLPLALIVVPFLNCPGRFLCRAVSASAIHPRCGRTSSRRTSCGPAAG